MIPNIFHYCYFGGKPFSIVNYLAIKSAFDVNHPTQISIYLDKEPESQWWEKARKLAQVVKIATPEEIFGVKLYHPAAKADVTRLQKLIDQGGIYLDLDVICVKPFTPLLDNQVVLAEEVINNKVVGLGSAVILSLPNANFLKRWFEGFDPERSLWKGFRSKGFDQYYSEIAIKYPKFLSTIYAEEVTILNYQNFYYPTYAPQDLADFYTKVTDRFDGAFCHHLWDSASYDQYLKNLTEEQIQSSDSTFNRLARRFL